MDELIMGDCIPKVASLNNGSIRTTITSPPYASQRAHLYASISEDDYPKWTLEWMSALQPKLTPDGSVLIVIRSHVHQGAASPYVLRTRLLLQENGWLEPEELIWLKPDGPPLGSYYRPRRTWESILWFSRTKSPFIDLHACGSASKSIGWEGSDRFAKSVVKSEQKIKTDGKSRVTDVFSAYVGDMARGIMHPAMYPETLTDQLVSTFSKAGDCILDPFCGSGTTLLSAQKLSRHYIGMDRSAEYIEIAKARLAAAPKLLPAA